MASEADFQPQQRLHRLSWLFSLTASAKQFIVPFVVTENNQAATLGLPEMIVMSVVLVFFVILCVAIASRLYEALADRLLRSA